MLGWKRVYIGDHTSGRSRKVIEGKGEEEGYLPDHENSESRSCLSCLNVSEVDVGMGGKVSEVRSE
jgi:hypothetical protein